MEEENFARTIDGGMAIFADMLAEHKAKGETVFSGADAFKLYDTYGFPIDLTLEMVADEGMTRGSGGLCPADAGAEGPCPGRPGRRWAIWPGPASTWGWTTPPTTVCWL